VIYAEVRYLVCLGSSVEFRSDWVLSWPLLSGRWQYCLGSRALAISFSCYFAMRFVSISGGVVFSFIKRGAYLPDAVYLSEYSVVASSFLLSIIGV